MIQSFKKQVYIILKHIIILFFIPIYLFSQTPQLYFDFRYEDDIIPSTEKFIHWKNKLFFNGIERSPCCSASYLWSINSSHQKTKLMEINVFDVFSSENYLLFDCAIPSNGGNFQAIITNDGVNYNVIPNVKRVSHAFAKNDTFYVNGLDQNYTQKTWRVVKTDNSFESVLIPFPTGLTVDNSYIINGTFYLIAASDTDYIYKLYRFDGQNLQLIRSGIDKIFYLNGAIYANVYNPTTLRYNLEKGIFDENQNINWQRLPYFTPNIEYDLGWIMEMVEYKNKLFFTGGLKVYGYELSYVENDTIKVVKDTFVETENNFAFNVDILGIANDRLIFQSTSPINNRLCVWTTDGTEQNTYELNENLVSDITYNFPEDIHPRNMNAAVYENRLFFLGKTDAFGEEVWFTDGTKEGTKMLYDLNNGANNSRPSDFYTYLNRLYFVARVPSIGRELWYFETNCPSERSVNGVATQNIGALDNISSTQMIPSNSIINYKSKKSIILQNGFNTQSGAVFKTELDYGCGF